MEKKFIVYGIIRLLKEFLNCDDIYAWDTSHLQHFNLRSAIEITALMVD